MLPGDHKPWAKTVARIVVYATVVALAVLAYFLEAHNNLHIPEIIGIFLLFLTIVPPNLAIIYPCLLPNKQIPRTVLATNRRHGKPYLPLNGLKIVI